MSWMHSTGILTTPPGAWRTDGQARVSIRASRFAWLGVVVCAAMAAGAKEPSEPQLPLAPALPPSASIQGRSNPDSPPPLKPPVPDSTQPGNPSAPQSGSSRSPRLPDFRRQLKSELEALNKEHQEIQSQRRAIQNPPAESSTAQRPHVLRQLQQDLESIERAQRTRLDEIHLRFVELENVLKQYDEQFDEHRNAAAGAEQMTDKSRRLDGEDPSRPLVPNGPPPAPTPPSPTGDSTESIPHGDDTTGRSTAPALNPDVASANPEKGSPRRPETEAHTDGETPVQPASSGPVVTDQPVDRLALADNLVRVGNHELALQTYQQIDLQQKDEQARYWVKYQMASCYRRLGDIPKAEKHYRIVAGLPKDHFLGESARWWLESLQKREQMRKGLQEFRQYLKTIRQSLDEK